MYISFSVPQGEVPPEQIEPVDLSVRNTKTSGEEGHTGYKALKDSGVVLKVPTFPIALQTLGLDLSLKAGTYDKCFIKRL